MDAKADGDFDLNIDVVGTPATSRSTAASPGPLSPSVLDPELSKHFSRKKTKSTKAQKRKRDEEDPEGTLATIKRRHEVEDERHLVREARETAREIRAIQSDLQAQEAHEANQHNNDRFINVLEFIGHC